MRLVEFACVFVRASGDRLGAAERLVCGLPHLLGPALGQVDLAFRTSSRYLVALLHLDAAQLDERAGVRLAFWTARAGGRASRLDAMPEAERRALAAHLDLCELRLKGLGPAELFERSAHLFTEAGAPPARRRNALDRPMLAIDVGGAGFEGVTYLPERRELLLPTPVAPPEGDELLVAFRLPGVDRPVGVRSKVIAVRPATAAPARPAGLGISLSIPLAATAVHDALVRHAPAPDAETRAAPRFQVRAPVKVLVPDPPAAPAPAAAPPAHAVIEYATDQELEADYVENLSHGGAFIRSAHPQPAGSALTLDFRLPNGAELKAKAEVVYANAQGMGVRLTLDPESEAALQAAIAHITARARRALVVDDDALVRQMLADALADRGFEVITAVDGEEGLRILSEELLALDLLVTDVRMPGLDGEQFVQRIRRAGGETDLTIVVVSGRLEADQEPRLEAAGADAVLDKALGPELVAQAADAALERKRVSRS